MRKSHFFRSLFCVLILALLAISCSRTSNTNNSVADDNGIKCHFTADSLVRTYFNHSSSIVDINEMTNLIVNESDDFYGQVRFNENGQEVILPFNISINPLGIPRDAIYNLSILSAIDSLTFRTSRVEDTLVSISNLSNLPCTILDTTEQRQNFYSVTFLHPIKKNHVSTIIDDIGKRYQTHLSKKANQLGIDSCKKPSDSVLEQLVTPNLIEIKIL